MAASVKNEFGTITVDDSVIATVVGMSALDCYGIVGMSSRKATDGLYELLGRENLRRGVEIIGDEFGVTINMFVVLEFGVSIAAVTDSLRETVQYRVETQTGIKVKKINITVQGIRVT